MRRKREPIKITEEDETPEKVIERLKMKEAAQTSQQPAAPVQDVTAGAEANDRI